MRVRLFVVTQLSYFPCPESEVVAAQRGELDAAKRALIDYPLSRFSNFFLSDLASQWKNRHPTEKEEGWMKGRGGGGGGIILNSL